MKKKKIKTGIFGTGFGATVVLPAVKNNHKLKLIGIYGRNKAKLESIKKKSDVEIFDNFKSLVDKIDLAIIALPPFMQYKFVQFAITKGKHVLCEKPFTTRVFEAKKLVNLIKNKNLYTAVSYQMRYQPLRLKIKKILSSKTLGKILGVKLYYDYSSRLYDVDKNTWKNDKRKGGGVINAMGSHQIDLLRWLFGEIKQIRGIKKNYHKIKNNKADDVFAGYLEFKNKLICSIYLSSVSIGWKTSYMDIYGEKGSLHLEGERDLYLIKKTKKEDQENSKKIRIKFKEELFKKKWVDKSIWRSSYFRMLNSLSDSIINKKKYSGASFRDALKTRAVIDNIVYSNLKT